MSWLRKSLYRLANAIVHRALRWVCAAGTVRPGSNASRRFGAFGDGTSMAFPTGTVFGERWIEIGHFTLIGAHVTLTAGFVPGLELGEKPIVRIGSGCAIGRDNHIIGHESIVIGDNVFTGPGVYITDQNHGYSDPDIPIGQQWPVNAPVEIGAGCWLGTRVVVLPGTRLGRNVVVAAGSVVRGEFDDTCVIAGSPARVVRRYIPGEGWQRPLKRDSADDRDGTLDGDVDQRSSPSR